jgi:two-component system alkaline phosphatase synthesis response regulator PhoP
MKRILVVDDEQDLREILQFNLESEGYAVDTAASAEKALKILSDKHDLILLDVMMDEMSGFQMANHVRNHLKKDIPIIFLTAKNTENDMLTGLNIGGDDYISKPFSLKEVLARIKVVLKRSIQAEVITSDDLTVDLRSKTVILNGKNVLLTKKEFLILHMLIQYPNTFFAREQILERVWDTLVLDRSVDVHIARLRKKLGNFGNRIVNRPGFGYCFEH